MSIPSRSNCPVCGSSDVSAFFDLPKVPTHCNILLTTREEAVAVPRGDIGLVFCHTCGHIYNAVFDPELMKYNQQYENSLHFSPRFQEFAEQLAESLTSRYNLYQKVVIDVGCGKGDFLRLMSRAGNNKGYGFDPSYVPNGDLDTASDLTFIQDFYSEKYSSYRADMICCRHVLEHIEQPCDFLAGIRRSIDPNDHSVVYFEVPNALFSLRDSSVWDIIYEHCGYFTPNSLIYLFQAAGFEVLHHEETYGGQFISIEAVLAHGDAAARTISTNYSILHLKQLADEFSQRYREKLTYWTYMLEELAEQSQKVALWGAGSKGVTFLNTVPKANTIRHVVDINPRKQGMYIAGTGHKIVSAEYLLDDKPDSVLVMNRLYELEIRQMLHNIAPDAEVLVV